jgi:Fe-S oxidoreductase
MSDVRIKEAQATGAQILVTACPLCRVMLEDARKAAGLNEILQVMDLNELVLQALEGKLVEEDVKVA